jgi:hypothetical protein
MTYTGSTSKYILGPDLALAVTLEQATRAEATKKLQNRDATKIS